MQQFVHLFYDGHDRNLSITHHENECIVLHEKHIIDNSLKLEVEGKERCRVLDQRTVEIR